MAPSYRLEEQGAARGRRCTSVAPPLLLHCTCGGEEATEARGEEQHGVVAELWDRGSRREMHRRMRGHGGEGQHGVVVPYIMGETGMDKT